VLPVARAGRVRELVYGADTLGDVRLLARELRSAGS
jgi:hypothetical protein